VAWSATWRIRGRNLTRRPTVHLPDIAAGAGGLLDSKVVGVDCAGKNLVGAFYPPRLRYGSTLPLTLPLTTVRQGWAGVKLGVADDDYFAFLKRMLALLRLSQTFFSSHRSRGISKRRSWSMMKASRAEGAAQFMVIPSVTPSSR
jgi:3-dehydroquinate synthetase